MLIDEQFATVVCADPAFEMWKIEYGGRNCYDSHNKMTEDSYDKFIRTLIKRGHESPLEFGSMMAELYTSRAVLAEITRHRLSSFAVTSQRYIKEDAEKKLIKFIKPTWFDEADECDRSEWITAMENAEESYGILLAHRGSAQEAREVLPNSTACRIEMSANLREWRHIFEMRCDKAAYPQIRILMTDVLRKAYELFPPVFEDLYEKFIGE